MVWCAVEGLDPIQVESDFVARVGDFVKGYVGLFNSAEIGAEMADLEFSNSYVTRL